MSRTVAAAGAGRGGAITPGLLIARIAGIEIRVDHTWLVAFALITWSLAATFYPPRLPGIDPTGYWALGVLSAFGLFASILLHELSHSLVARAKGLRVRGITLFIFGGVSSIEADAESPGDEFVIAIVGPLTSLALAGLAFGAGRAMPAGTAAAELVGYLALVNLIVGLFNLVPGFPLDGGRVLRAGLWKATGSLGRATRWASYAGQFVGYGLIFLGVSEAFGGNVLGGVWIAFIGWFLAGAAQSSRQQQEMDAGLRGVPVSALMDPTPPTAGPELTVRDFLFERVLREGERAVLVLDGDRLAGIVTVSDAKSVGAEDRERSTVGEIMSRAPLRTIAPDAPALDALRELVSGGFEQLPVVRDGRLVGSIGRAEVLRALALREQLGLDLRGGGRKAA